MLDHSASQKCAQPKHGYFTSSAMAETAKAAINPSAVHALIQVAAVNGFGFSTTTPVFFLTRREDE